MHDMPSVTEQGVTTDAEKWVTLLTNYAAHEDGPAKALFHERMERSVAELQIPAIEFKHPMEDEILQLFDAPVDKWPNLVLAGEAGVGKTRLVHKIHLKIGGDPKRLAGKGPQWKLAGTSPDGGAFVADINRDLSASRSLGASEASTAEADKIEEWSKMLLGQPADIVPKRFFVIAANDGQMLKAWNDHRSRPIVATAHDVIEDYLRTGSANPDLPFRLFHLSSVGTDIILGQCLNAVLEHPGWKWLKDDHSSPNDIFSTSSPLFVNYQALSDPIFRERLTALGRLCDANEWHFPVRNVLAMFANALLGIRERGKTNTTTLSVPKLRALIAEGKAHASNFFANMFGLNLDPIWRERTLGPIESFRVGLETSNRIDGLILFGADDEDYKTDYETLYVHDPIFPPDPVFEKYRTQYLSVGPQAVEGDNPFQEQLIAQRRRLFFRIPSTMEAKYDPWSLTNFHYAKVYLEEILGPIAQGDSPRSRHLATLVTALNRIWTGLLLDESDQLFVTTALDFATGVASEIEVKRIPTRVTSGDDYPCVDLDCTDGPVKRPRISVFHKPGGQPISIVLTLTRFEFLQRVAAGALPSSFSRECSEDMRAYKSQVLASLPVVASGSIKLLHVNNDGTAGRMAINIHE